VWGRIRRAGGARFRGRNRFLRTLVGGHIVLGLGRGRDNAMLALPVLGQGDQTRASKVATWALMSVYAVTMKKKMLLARAHVKNR
jgi:hypothetical protein